MQPQRLFVAIHLPETISSILEQRQLLLRQHLGVQHSALCWTPKKQFHLTLAFLGAVDSTDIDSVAKTLDAHCQKYFPQSLRLGKCGLFARRGVPTVLWCDVQVDPQLHHWCQELRQKLQSFCPHMDGKEFHPHLTLGRIKSGRSINRNLLINLFEQTPLCCDKPSWECHQLSLVQSEHCCQGATHQLLHTSTLNPKTNTL